MDFLFITSVFHLENVFNVEHKTKLINISINQRWMIKRSVEKLYDLQWIYHDYVFDYLK